MEGSPAAFVWQFQMLPGDILHWILEHFEFSQKSSIFIIFQHHEWTGVDYLWTHSKYGQLRLWDPKGCLEVSPNQI